MKIFNVFLLVASFYLVSCGSDKSEDLNDCSVEKVEVLSDSDAVKMLDAAVLAEGAKYLWGGQSLSDGFDCSGLMLWAADYSALSSYWLDGEGRLVGDVTADVLYRHNSELVAYDQIKLGDIIFFDTDSDGVMDHSSYFINYGSGDGPYVFDAYSVSGEVGYRYVKDFWSKNPVFARLKIIHLSCE